MEVSRGRKVKKNSEDSSQKTNKQQPKFSTCCLFKLGTTKLPISLIIPLYATNYVFLHFQLLSIMCIFVYQKFSQNPGMKTSL